MACKKLFTILYGTRSYIVIANRQTTAEMVWESQKCWFSAGTAVTIIDEQNNIKEFVKE